MQTCLQRRYLTIATMVVARCFVHRTTQREQRHLKIRETFPKMLRISLLLVATHCFFFSIHVYSVYYLFVAECWAPAELLGSSRAPSLNSLGLRSSSTLTKNINRATCQELEFETSVLGRISEAFTQWSSESCTTRRDHGQNFESVHCFTRSKPIHNMRKNEFELTFFCTLGSVSGSFNARR